MVILIPQFYKLQIEWDVLKDEEISGKKYLKMADLFKRYSNGYAICMAYGNLDEQGYNNSLANTYSTLSKEYHELGIKMLQPN